MNSSEYAGRCRGGTCRAGVGRQQVGLVDDRRVEPSGQHVGSPLVRVHRHVQVAGAGLADRLSLVGGHQGAAARVAEDHDGVDAGGLAQPSHAMADVGERVLQSEVRALAPVPRVPAEEPEPALGERAGHVVVGVVDDVMRGEERHRRPAARGPVVDALVGIAAEAVPRCISGSERNPFFLHSRTSLACRHSCIAPRSCVANGGFSPA